MKKSVLVIAIIGILFVSWMAWFSLRTSEEVLTAFGKMDEKLQEVNDNIKTSNDSLINQIANNELKEQVNLVDSVTTDFTRYLDSVKQQMLGDIQKTDYEKMDASSTMFFDKNKPSEEGKKLISEMDRFRERLLGLTSDTVLKKEINTLFSTSQITRDGKKYDWLSYNFKDFPLVAAMAKLTQMQVDVSRIKREVLDDYIQAQE